MALRSVASLSLSFGLVSIPVKVYAATESSAAIQFKLRARGGARVRQQYVTDPEAVVENLSPPAPSRPGPVPVPPALVPSPAVATAPSRPAAAALAATPADTNAAARPWRGSVAAVPPPAPARPDPEPTVVERSDMVKGYEFEPGQFVLFEPDELKALAEASRQTIDIVAFIPEHSVDPIHYDKAYFLAPDKRGGKPYSLLLKAMRRSRRSALAKWAWRSKQYMVQIRPVEGGLVLQQLLYADEVRSIGDLGIDLVEVGDAELDLAIRLIEQISEDRYDPSQYVDEEKERILAAVREKIAGRQIVVEHGAEPRTAPSAQVIDLVAALKASLGAAAAPRDATASAEATATPARERKPVRRAGRSADAPAPATADGKVARGAGARTKAAEAKAAETKAAGARSPAKKTAAGKR